MTATMPLISVIVPVYNGETTIKETIESVLNQTFVNLELIVIDDGSQDSTLNVIANIQDSRLKVFSYKNAGVAISRNRGIKKAGGQFISFLDADDLWTLDKLESQLKALQSTPQAAVAYSWVDYINAEGEFLHNGNHITINGDAYKQMLVENVLENGSNPLIIREALIQVGGFNQSLTPAEDWDMWLRLAARYEFVTVPSPQILYRTLSHSGSTNVLKMEKVCSQLIEQAFNRAPASVQYLKKRASGILYYYLIHKSLESNNSSQNSIAAMRFFYNTIRYDASVWQWRIMLKTIIRISTLFLLSPLLYQRFKAVYRRFYAKDSRQLQHNL
ncbi:glycosyl transferase [Rivularia sp. PCC 7116]|uniref:glycosyltransferase n=1 Tax=Rivularia sp. PCC 7116 TaxID=373994 RepID=UPI00029EEACD|nr:glycosyltransferase [Rivularia sp. PCC 7116]AFY58652.1 glycosyl transferase [Rivularia sp. PCC 7116]